MNEETKNTEAMEEIAKQDFDRICKVARLKMDRKRDHTVQRDLEKERDYIIEEIIDGRIVVDGDGWPTVITENENLKEVKFKRRPIGRDLLAMDRFKATQEMSKYNAVIATYLGIDKSILEGLDSVDLDNVQALHGIFLGNRN